MVNNVTYQKTMNECKDVCRKIFITSLIVILVVFATFPIVMGEEGYITHTTLEFITTYLWAFICVTCIDLTYMHLKLTEQKR